MVGGVSGIGQGAYFFNPYQLNMGASAVGGVNAASEVAGMKPLIKPMGVSEEEKGAGVEGVKKGECQTCKNRKYVDGSDEMVSFKSPAKISPDAAGGRVRAHEQEHVSNAFTKAARDGGKVLQASVAMKMAICPECGRSYIAGGETTTKIAYPKDNNPYTKNQKAANYNATAGANIDAAV